LETAVVFKGIKKYFTGTKALDWDAEDVMEVFPGEIHGIVGENGAGKSTLLQILMGIYDSTDGEISVFGNEYKPKTTRDAEAAGISIIMQQPNFAYNMTVAENIYMGHDKKFTNGLRLIDWKKQNEAASGILREYNYGHIKPTEILRNLSFEERKQVEIARALSIRPRILLVDETSAAISRESVENLYELLRNLRNQGTAIIYISHFIDEVYALCDKVSVLRDGKLVAKMTVSETSPSMIINSMVGRDISGENYRSEDNSSIGDVVLDVRNLSSHDSFRDVNLTVKQGEIVGIAGIGGCGSDNLGRALFGYEKVTGGEIYYKGVRITIESPMKATKNRIGYIPKDRDLEGLFLIYNIILNNSSANLAKMNKNGIMKGAEEKAAADKSIEQLRIKAPSAATTVENLSGGNRQKVAIAKWLANESDLLIFNSPTRGVDVGAKYEIYKILEELKNRGKAIILISDELPELIGMSDRIYCLKKGTVSGEFDRVDGFTEESVIVKMV